MPRVYCPLPLAEGHRLLLPATAARHVQVLRMQPGAALTLFNGQGGEWAAVVLRMGRSEVEVEIGRYTALEREAMRAVHILVGMPANERMDWLVEKATELGASSIWPLITARSVLKLAGERAVKRQAHWQMIAIAACEQCGRNRVPVVHAPRPLAQVFSLQEQEEEKEAVRFLLSLSSGAVSLHQASISRHQPLWLLHGPEGGLTLQEEDTAIAHGFTPASLGTRTLRAETAAIAALAMLLL